jgi:hypothetical protein
VGSPAFAATAAKPPDPKILIVGSDRRTEVMFVGGDIGPKIGQALATCARHAPAARVERLEVAGLPLGFVIDRGAIHVWAWVAEALAADRDLTWTRGAVGVGYLALGRWSID